MKPQREPSGEHVNYLLPPLSLTFTMSQKFQNRCYLDVRVYSGSHCFCHRELEAFYDRFDEIPAMVTSSLMSWTLWLVQFEAERRQQSSGRHRQLAFRFPDWPSPTDVQKNTLPEEF